MSKHVTAAHYLAHEIEWITAKRLAQEARRRHGPRVEAEQFFDPHAATELGNLIADRMRLIPEADEAS